jgi:hypothetical protein
MHTPSPPLDTFGDTYTKQSELVWHNYECACYLDILMGSDNLLLNHARGFYIHKRLKIKQQIHNIQDTTAVSYNQRGRVA